MPKTRKPEPMKDTFTSSLSQATDRMLPSDGSFTRPRRFSDLAESDLAEEVTDADIVIEDLAEPFPNPATTRRRALPQVQTDLWPLLHQQEPGKDQHILPGSQAEEDFRETDVSRAFDLLRTRLRQTVKQHGWTNIGVVSPTGGCGNTFTAANLAASLARIPSSRIVLMDMNMRAPGLAAALDMDASAAADLCDFLAGDVAISDYLLRASDSLAVGLNAQVQPDAAEILQDPATLDSIAHMQSALKPDMVIYDLPPLLCHDDASAFLPQLDGVLLVSDGTQTMAKHLKECERILEGQTALLGVILNRARASSIERF